MTLRPSSTDRGHARKTGPVSEITGGVKSFDHEKGEYVKPGEDVETKTDMEAVKAKIGTMSGKEIDEFMTEQFDQKIDRRKFRTDEAVRVEALKILNNFI